jgi:ABC-2 type transport system permease protein
MLAVYKRELQGYFYSPIAYVFMGIFLLVSGVFFAMSNILADQANFNGMLGSISFLFMLCVPILTMRLMSEERKNKTDQLLLTSPLSITDIVMGKFFAACTVFLATLVITAIYPIVLFLFGNPSIIEILTGYLGFFLLGVSLISVGVFISALTENQVTSAVITFGVLLLLYIGSSWLTQIIGIAWIVSILQWFSVYDRLQPFTNSVLSVTQIIYYISFAAVFIFLSIRTVERRRWSEV